MPLSRNGWLCRTCGHWISCLEHSHDPESGDAFTRWRCGICGLERTSRSGQVKAAKNWQSWIVVSLAIVPIRMPLILAQGWVPPPR